MIKKSLIALTIAFGTLITTQAHAELSYNLGVTSLYKYKGLDQHTKSPKSMRPALQGGIDWKHDSGFYAGNWNSTGTFDNGTFDNGNLEMDFYAGYANSINEQWSYDLSAKTYVYPDASHWNGTEIQGVLMYKNFGLKYTRGVSKSLKDTDSYSLVYSHPINDKWTLDAEFGRMRPASSSNYNFATVGATYAISDTLSAKFEVSGASKRDSMGMDDPYAKTRGIITLTKTW